MIEKKKDGVFTACGSESYKYRFARSMTMLVAIRVDMTRRSADSRKEADKQDGGSDTGQGNTRG